MLVNNEYKILLQRMSMPARSVVGIASFLLLASCADNKFHRAEVAKEAQTALVGMPRKELLACAGVPVRSAVDGTTEFMTYVGGGDSTGAAVATTNGNVGVGVVSTKHRYCEVTFVLENGIVQKLNYAGRTGGYATEGEQCAYVVQGCMKQ